MLDHYAMDSDFLEFVKTEDALFHYTKRKVAFEYILPTKKIKLSQRINTNDPWEYKFRLLNTIGWSLPSECEKLSTEVHPKIDRILRYEWRIGCFCSNNKPSLILKNGDLVEDIYALNEGWDKPRMWSQYGDNHSGVCIVFSKKEIEKTLYDMNLSEDRYKCNFITYIQENGMPYKSFTIDGNQLSNEGVEVYADMFVTGNMDEIFFRKHIDYRDESEYRLAIHDSKNLYEYFDINSSLKGIILGDQNNDEDRQSSHQVCRKFNIGCGYVGWDRGTSHLLLCSEQNGKTNTY